MHDAILQQAYNLLHQQLAAHMTPQQACLSQCVWDRWRARERTSKNMDFAVRLVELRSSAVVKPNLYVIFGLFV